MKKLVMIFAILLFAGAAVAQPRIIMVPAQPRQNQYQPQYPVFIDEEYLIDGRRLVPEQPPQSGYIYDERGHSYFYQESRQEPGSFFIYRQFSPD
jgi:hypothetical protein